MTAIILDTETTDRDAPEIIEVAYQRLSIGSDLMGPNEDVIPTGADGRLLVDSDYCARFKPEKVVSFGSIAVHHILPIELQDCPPSSSFALPDGTAYIVGHSIDFDWKAIGAPAAVKRICTHAMAQHLWPEADSHSQSALLYRLLGATPETRDRMRNAHSAMVDVANNLILLQHILQAEPEITTWSALWAFSEEARVPRVCTFQRYRGLPLEEVPVDFIEWVLRQDWIDEYQRKGYSRALRNAYADEEAFE